MEMEHWCKWVNLSKKRARDFPAGIYLPKVNNKTLEQGVKYVQSQDKTPERPYFTPSSSVSDVNFEQLNTGWVRECLSVQLHIKL